MSKHRRPLSLAEKYPPSPPCSCDICRNYCRRPGWWTVEEARNAAESGYWKRMMLEISPELSFGVLAPAFRGCEMGWALQLYAGNGCTFLSNGLCELHGSGFQPLECRFCHHTRQGLGQRCHTDLERDWQTPAGRALVAEWARLTRLLPKA